MKNVLRKLEVILAHNKDGSFSTQANRKRILIMAMNELHDLGFKIEDPHNLGSRHVIANHNLWKGKGLSIGTIKNRTSHYRWLAKKIGKPNIVPRTNKELGIPNRSRSKKNKAKTLDRDKVMEIDDPHLRISLFMQEQFGLRRETALKIKPYEADKGDHILLKASWTKGGKEYAVKIRNKEQRDVLNDAKHLAGKASLIPSHLTYAQHLRKYEYYTDVKGLNKNHGLRHHYAQTRFFELTDFQCPKCGGPSRKELMGIDIVKDRTAREIISKELGHERISITYDYLGS